MFIEWWNSIGLATQIFYCIAIPATLILLVQTVLMLLGFGDNADADVDLDTSIGDVDIDDGAFDDSLTDVGDLDALYFFTFRGIVAFFVVFGWVGIAMQSAGVNLAITLIVATVCGLSIMVAIAYLFRAIMKLRSDGTADNRNALGVAGKVYLTVPPSRSGEGKVNIMLQGAYVERNAVTDEAEPIPTGHEIIVVGTSGQTSVVVKRK